MRKESDGGRKRKEKESDGGARPIRREGERISQSKRREMREMRGMMNWPNPDPHSTHQPDSVVSLPSDLRLR